MKPVTIYGFRCSKKDEKVLMKRVDEFLATHDRTTSKTKNPSLLRAYAPLTIKHFYWNLNKEMGTWFDIYPNEDANGQYFFPDQPECGWLMHVRLDLNAHPKIEKEKSEGFVLGVVSSIQYEHVILRESDDFRVGLTRQGDVDSHHR